MESLAIFTIVSNNYLAYAATWLQSVRKFHVNAVIRVVVVDDPKIAKAWLGDEVVIDARDVIGPGFADMALRYDALELNTAAKPYAIRYLMQILQVEAVVYLDPDIQLFAPLNPVLAPLSNGASAVLTPHTLEPYFDSGRPSDLDFLRSGVFNLGFIGLSRGEESKKFIEWWALQLATLCLADPANGFFTDQKWLDLAPAFLPSLAICRHPGANLAYWNLAQRNLAFKDDEWKVDDQALIFFHFSGFDPNEPNRVSRHEDRLGRQTNTPVAQLLQDYAMRIRAHRWEESSKIPYAYGAFAGTWLSRPIRRLYARMNPAPLAEQQVRAIDISALCCESDPAFRRFPALKLNRLAGELLRMHPEIQPIFSVDTPLGRWRFLRWIRRHAIGSYGLDAGLLN